MSLWELGVVVLGLALACYGFRLYGWVRSPIGMLVAAVALAFFPWIAACAPLLCALALATVMLAKNEKIARIASVVAGRSVAAYGVSLMASVMPAESMERLAVLLEDPAVLVVSCFLLGAAFGAHALMLLAAALWRGGADPGQVLVGLSTAALGATALSQLLRLSNKATPNGRCAFGQARHVAKNAPGGTEDAQCSQPYGAKGRLPW